MCSGGSVQAHHLHGLPHSEIPGSTLDCNSPRRIVAYHVLHRPSAPRHPPRALCSLISALLFSSLLLLLTLDYIDMPHVTPVIHLGNTGNTCACVLPLKFHYAVVKVQSGRAFNEVSSKVENGRFAVPFRPRDRL